jgi:uncharacterized membrane protein YgdD (TMEM256/DUF423 family)
MNRTLTLLAVTLGLTGVATGALGAHGVKTALATFDDAAQRVGWWETAARYHLAHAFALGLAAVLAAHVPGRLPKLGAGLLVAGVLLFSGSLYLLTFTGKNALVFVTPFGGLFLLAGWAVLFAAALRLPREP